MPGDTSRSHAVRVGNRPPAREVSTRGGCEETVGQGSFDAPPDGGGRVTSQYLEGRWRLRRRWRESTSGEAAWAVGFVDVVPAGPGGFLWREEARVHLVPTDRSASSRPRPDSQVWFAARRVLRLVPAADGALDVRFEDGRAFHRLDLSRGSWQADHLCGSDLYRSSWQVWSEDCMEVLWEVEGPATSGWLRSVLMRRPPTRGRSAAARWERPLPR